ncbi:hypothetical protein B0H13DRAFT_1863256, partial [Mycena leptocephala]
KRADDEDTNPAPAKQRQRGRKAAQVQQVPPAVPVERPKPRPLTRRVAAATPNTPTATQATTPERSPVLPAALPPTSSLENAVTLNGSIPVTAAADQHGNTSRNATGTSQAVPHAVLAVATLSSTAVATSSIPTVPNTAPTSTATESAYAEGSLTVPPAYVSPDDVHKVMDVDVPEQEAPKLDISVLREELAQLQKGLQIEPDPIDPFAADPFAADPFAMLTPDKLAELTPEERAEMELDPDADEEDGDESGGSDEGSGEDGD